MNTRIFQHSFPAALVFCLLLFPAVTQRIYSQSTPPIENQEYQKNRFNEGQHILLSLKTFPPDSRLYLEGELISPSDTRYVTDVNPSGEFRDYRLPEGPLSVILTAEGYRPKVIRLEPQSAGPASDNRPIQQILEEKLEPFGTRLRYLHSAGTGEQPKSVECFPGTPTRGELAVAALLKGSGVEIFHARTGELVKRIAIPEPYGNRLGFVESVYLPEKEEIWVSQMETEMIHIIDSRTLEYDASVPSGGRWTKVLTLSPDGEKIYASNWLSDNLGVINTGTRKLEKTIPLSGIPRGSAFTADGEYLYICIYETGNIEKIHVPTGRSTGIIETGPGAARHIVHDRVKNLFYISDMWHGAVYSLNPETDAVEKRIRVGPNLNTIKLSNDGRYLFVSSRGKNNRRTYLVEGPEFGTISVIDTRSFMIIDRIYGGDQPTGLALSVDNRILIFSDFLDRSLEYYNIESYWTQN